MHQRYDDIMRRIPERPAWFDDAGVPRYDAFAPDDLANIYAREAALAEVSCQGCGTRFTVALTDAFGDEDLSLGDMIRLRRVRYGDPPNVGCCPGGPTMNSVTHEVLQYWRRGTDLVTRWTRDPACEGPVAEGRLDFVDAVPAVLAAFDGGAAAVRVACTSVRSRLALAGRLVAAAPAGARVLLACPDNMIGLVRHCLRRHVPDSEVGSWADRRRVTLLPFSRIPVSDRGCYCLVIVAGAPPREAATADWQAIASQLAARVPGRLLAELTLAQSAPMIGRPDVVIDAGTVVAAR